MKIETSLSTIEVLTTGIEISAADHKALESAVDHCEKIREIQTQCINLYGPQSLPLIAQQLISGELSALNALVAVSANVDDTNSRILTDSLGGEINRCPRGLTPICSLIRSARCSIILGRAKKLETAERAGLTAAGLEDTAYQPSDAVLKLGETIRRELDGVDAIPTSLASVKRLLAMAIPAKK